MKYDLELFNQGNHYIKLETQEKYDEVMECLDENGYKWNDGKELKCDDYWGVYHERTSIRVSKIKRISYATDSYYRKNRMTELVLVEPKQDLRELLKVGYKVDTLPERLTQGNIDDMIKIDFDFNEIYRPKYNGIKPMEWALVWKREEELFTLELPNSPLAKKYLKYDLDSNFKYRFINKKKLSRNDNGYTSIFTKEQIDKIKELKVIRDLDIKKL